jgi:hypothetical protein
MVSLNCRGLSLDKSYGHLMAGPRPLIWTRISLIKHYGEEDKNEYQEKLFENSIVRIAIFGLLQKQPLP